MYSSTGYIEEVSVCGGVESLSFKERDKLYLA